MSAETKLTDCYPFPRVPRTPSGNPVRALNISRHPKAESTSPPLNNKNLLSFPLAKCRLESPRDLSVGSYRCAPSLTKNWARARAQSLFDTLRTYRITATAGKKARGAASTDDRTPFAFFFSLSRERVNLRPGKLGVCMCRSTR